MADRFVMDHAAAVRYCDDMSRWFIWDETRWARDRSLHVWALAEYTIAKLNQELREVVKDSSSYVSIDKIKTAMRKRSGMKNMLEISKGRPSLAIIPDILDRDPWLFNTSSCTLDLRTGLPREHSPGDLITKISGAPYNASAECPGWIEFLRQIFKDEEVIRYVQRVVGYCLTGTVKEHAMFFCYGTGANGKSVMWTVIQKLMGEYGMQASSDLLVVSKGDKHPTDMASLMGSRLALTTEVKRGRTLDESRLKQLTGGDRVSAHFMRQDFIEFDMTAKLVMAANHRPPVDTFDEGTWRRIHLINYGVTIPEGDRDKDLAEKLMKELPGILNWALDGLLDYRELGALEPPASVRADVAEYRAEMDVFGRFIAECCVLSDPDARMRPGLGRAAYCAWAHSEGFGSRSSRWFAQQMKDRGVTKTMSGGKQFYRGIGLLNDWHDRAADWKDKDE